jgi:transcriptional regulator with GAF, ATPase, and Fis domain
MVEASETQTIIGRAAGICQETLGDAVTVSLVAGDPLGPLAVASTTKLAQELDGAQVRAQSGPSVLAHQRKSTVVATDVQRDDRWPTLRVESAHPVVGCVSVPLLVGEDLTGCLTVYARHAAVDDLVEGCELMAATIASVLQDLRLRQELEAMAANLETALTSRATIDQAKGIVMAERRCRADEAFEYLVGLSSSRHVRLRDLSQAIVDQASESS